ncbi:hypothetical protein D4R51_04320, partial [bacterium]
NEIRFMNGRSRLPAGRQGLPSPNSLFKEEKNNQNLGGQGFQERIVLRRLLLALVWCRFPIIWGCCRIKYRIERT